MKKTIKVRTESLEQARTNFKEEIPENIFVLDIITEYGSYKPIYDTGYSIGDTVDEAIESAKKGLPDPYSIKGEVVPELKPGTNIKVPVLVKADSEWFAKHRAEDYFKNKFFPNSGFGVAELSYSIIDTNLTQSGFKGVFGVGKQEDTYTVTFLIKPYVKLKYSMWSYIVAEITDDIYLANKKLLEFAKYGSFNLKGIERLISQGVDINFADEHGRNVLFYSCHDYEISKLFIDKGVDYRKTDTMEDNILTYCFRNSYRIHDKIIAFLETNGIERDKDLVNRIHNEEREAKQRAIEHNKRWCPQCNRKVITVDENDKYFDDGWMEEVDIKCSICGTLIEHYRGQIR